LRLLSFLPGISCKWTAPIVQRKKDASLQLERLVSHHGMVGNDILSSLPADETELIKPHLEEIELSYHSILHEAGEALPFTYFLSEGLASLVVVTSDGKSVEVAIAGREGMVGTPVIVGIGYGPYRVVMQIAGRALRIKAETLVEILENSPVLASRLHRYVLIQGLQIAQIAACNRLHEVEQRLARWLLMCHDRVDSELLPVTHEFLAQMLGTGRPSISLAAGLLQRAGVIANFRGRVKIVNRKSLERTACECYRAMRAFSHGRESQ
jgi:CRP-like cAMP-binding protein